MQGSYFSLTLALLFMAMVQAVPWWSDIGATHGAKAAPLTLLQLAGHFAHESVNDNGGFPWRALEAEDDSDFQPRSRKIAATSVLDEDHDDVVSPAEWSDYVSKLKETALHAIVRSSNPVAKRFLRDIILYHYNNLDDCISKHLKHTNNKAFEDIAAVIESSCYVKLRYSIFAGPPTFDMVAKKQPYIRARNMELWFKKQVGIAYSDLKNNRVLGATVDSDALTLKALKLCVDNELDPWGDTELSRDDFYGALASILQCA